MISYDDAMRLPYKEFLEEILREAPKNCTWYTVRDWMREHFTPEQVSAMYAKLYQQLVALTPDDQEEDPAADELREQMDIFWYAGSQELHERAIAQLKENNML